MKIFLLFFITTGIYFFSGVGLTNSGDSPQYQLTQSIADRNSICLSDYGSSYPDIGYLNGCIISGRGIGESLIAVPFYIFTKIFSSLVQPPYNGQRSGVDSQSGTEASTAMVNAFFGALSVIMVYYISSLLFGDKNDLSSFISALLFAFGSLNWKYSSIFYRHPISLFFILLTTYFLFRLIEDRNKNRATYFLFCLSIALSFFVEPTSILFCIMAVILYTLSQYSKNFLSRGFILSQAILFSIVLIINIPIFTYNFKVFSNPLNFGWEHQLVNTWLSDKKLNFSTPLIPSIKANLFSPSVPIPKESFSTKLLDNETIKEQQGYYFASTYDYKGVFFQSPYLFLVFISFFLIKNKSRALKIVLLALSATYFSFKYLVFYSPNSYDTRFFIPIYGLLSILISPAINYVLNLKNQMFRLLANTSFGFLVAISLVNSWISVVENYAPNITGEKRAYAYQLLQHSKVPEIIRETFPNMYNYQIFFMYMLSFGIIYLFSKKILSCSVTVFRKSNLSRFLAIF